MKAERWANEDTLRGTLLLRMATLETLAKQRRRHPEGSLPSSKDSTRSSRGVFRKKGTSIVKKQKERGFKPPREAARSLQFSIFLGDLGAGGRSRELMPDVTAIYGRRLSESASKPIDAQWDGRQAQTGP